MKKISVIMIAAVIGLVPLAASQAQVGMGAVTWNVSDGLGDTGDFISDISYIGFGIEGRSYIAKSFTIGVEFSWQVWDEQSTDAIEIEGGTLTGKQFRYINAFPMLATLDLYAGEIHNFRMFLGVGVGAYYIMKRLQIGLANLEDKDWFFGGGPEFGFLIPWNEVYFLASARMNYAVRNFSDTEDAEMWWTAKIGVAYDRW
jgi:hypothetical protein